VHQHPDQAALYLFLGRASERAFAGQPLKARQCYQRVLEISSWGEHADAAKQALAVLPAR